MLILRRKTYSHIKFQKKNFGVIGEVGNAAGGIVNKTVDTAKNVTGAAVETTGNAIETAGKFGGLTGLGTALLTGVNPVLGLGAGLLLKKPIKALGQSIQDTGQSIRS